jgi:uncharacterized protein
VPRNPPQDKEHLLIAGVFCYIDTMQKITTQYKNLQLSGNVFASKNEDKMPGVLLIHGWRSGQDRFFDLAKQLADKGFVCLTFDLPGHQESGGDVNELSIENYLEAVITAYDFLIKIPKVDNQNITVIGSSFGSYLSAILSSKRPVKNLVLRVPSNYPDNEFKEIKVLKSSEFPGVMEWRSNKLGPNETLSLKAVHDFTGNIFIMSRKKTKWCRIKQYKTI